MSMFKKTGGFTLVELIVVIAILAILAGVAVPAYSGYIQKADKAADTTLLGTVNTAFSAACLDNGLNQYEVLNAKLNIGSDGTIGATAARAATSYFSVVKMRDGKDVTALINESFAEFFAGNEGAKFKVIRNVGFKDGMLVEGVSVELPSGGVVYLTSEQVELLKDSTYSEDIGGLMIQVDGVGGLVEGLLGEGGNNPTAMELLAGFMNDKNHLTSVITALGGNITSNELEDLQNQYGSALVGLVNDQVRDYIAKQEGIDPEDVDLSSQTITDKYDVGGLTDQYTSEIQKNMLVMGIAQSAATQNASTVMGFINSTTPKQDLITAMRGEDTAAGMANAALLYGAYTAYAKSSSATDAAKDAIANDSDPTAVFDALEDEDELKAFQAYMATTQGKTDLDACIAAMDVVNNTTSDSDAITGILTNGFADQDLIDALESMFQ